jgi:peptidoglycan/LPS O-acetylase OafA/YrhL
MPGLDGLRAIAVAAVVVYHIWPTVLPAGFLGVSMFFTLSGFLITRLLLLDHARSGGIGLRRFWVRRFRRLMPASLVVLVIISAIWLLTSWMTKVIAGDITAALLYVANWRFLFSGNAYGTAAATSPVLHFWSLAIEEQFYLVYPLAVWLVLRRKRASIFSVGIMLIGLLAASLAFIAFNSGDQLIVYYSTFSRAAELLVGGLLAVGTALWPLDRIRAWIRPVGIASALILVVLTFRSDIATPLYAEGGLAIIGLLSAAVILAASQGGRYEWTLSRKPLLWLGLISYAVYLIHWPLLIGLRHLHLTAWLVSLVTVVGSLVLAVLSGRLVEWPIREARWVRPRPVLLVGPLLAVVLALCLIGAQTAPTTGLNYDAAQKAIDQLTAAASSNPTTPTSAGAPASTKPLSVAFFGDSTAVMLSLAAANAGPGLQSVGGAAKLGCTISRGGEVKGVEGNPARSVQVCDWAAWPKAIPAGGVDRAIVYGGSWDTLPRKVPGAFSGWKSIDDEEYRTYLGSEMLGATEVLHKGGAAKVVWLTLALDRGDTDTDNARHVDEYNTLIDQTVAVHPDYAVKVDVASYFSGPGDGLRPDGVHVNATTGGKLWNDWLLDQITTTSSDRPGPSS